MHPQQRQAPFLWRLVKELGGPVVIVSAIVYASRLDSSVTAFAKATDKLAGAVEALSTQQHVTDKAVMRDSIRIVEHERRLDQLESQEVRRGRR